MLLVHFFYTFLQKFKIFIHLRRVSVVAEISEMHISDREQMKTLITGKTTSFSMHSTLTSVCLHIKPQTTADPYVSR